MKAADENCLELVGNLWKVRKSWASMERILGREGASPHVLGMLFKVVVKAVLLLESETWVMTPSMGKELGSFQHRVSRQITGRHLKRREDGSWEYLPLETAMEQAGFEVRRWEHMS